jgi:hypothetical protein
MSKFRNFDPYADEKNRLLSEKIAETNNRRVAALNARKKPGSVEAVLGSWKSGQSRKGKQQVSLPSLKFLSEKD